MNEYNAGTIFQRVNSAIGSFKYDNEAGIEEVDKGYIDLFLHIHQKPIPLDRLLERRADINSLYSHLPDSDIVIITFGLVESWYDNLHQCYLNKAPSKKIILSEPNRYEFHRMDLDDILKFISPSIESILLNKNTKIILTVSPVPIEATFTNYDSITANYYSKSVLRVASQLFAENFDKVIYFPSYEIVMSNGSNSFAEDNVHVRHEAVNVVMNHLLRNVQKDNSNLRDNNYIDDEANNRLNT